MSLRVLIYREDSTQVDAKLELARLRQAAAAQGAGCRPDRAIGLLIRVGELEAALADARSNIIPLPIECTRAREASLEAARLWIRASRDGCGDSGALATSLARLAECSLPESITARVSEGFAYYALFPETYVLAAEQYARRRQPSSVVVLGIRSIGTTLSAVVAAALETRGCAVASCTVRPDGHPFDRRLHLAEDLSRYLTARAAEGASFAIVDEGPGLSGSSFASVVAALEALRIDRCRIALFPSWNPDPDRLRSLHAQAVWRAHERYTITAQEAGIAPERIAGAAGAVDDWSAGRWRTSVLGTEAAWPAVQPQHERWKVRLRDQRGVVRFAGLGEYGERIARRAHGLFEAGLGGAAGTLRRGFLDLSFVEGVPLVSGAATAPDAGVIGDYIGRVSRLFRLEGHTDAASLRSMLETNVAELLDETRGMPEFVPGPVVEIDGRMLPYEWLRTSDGLRKTDALDHHADHFFPGPTDPSWDLAGAAIELTLDDAREGALLDAYIRASGDRGVAARLPFYRAAYAAFRGGYCAMQAEALGEGAEAARFVRARDRYAAVLRRLLRCPTPPNGP